MEMDNHFFSPNSSLRMKQVLSILMLLLLSVGVATAQRTVVGTVTGDDGEALIGASVRVVGTAAGRQFRTG